jgi:hypothetical protein
VPISDKAKLRVGLKIDNKEINMNWYVWFGCDLFVIGLWWFNITCIIKISRITW